MKKILSLILILLSINIFAQSTLKVYKVVYSKYDQEKQLTSDAKTYDPSNMYMMMHDSIINIDKRDYKLNLSSKRKFIKDKIRFTSWDGVDDKNKKCSIITMDNDSFSSISILYQIKKDAFISYTYFYD